MCFERYSLKAHPCPAGCDVTAGRAGALVTLVVDELEVAADVARQVDVESKLDAVCLRKQALISLSSQVVACLRLLHRSGCSPCEPRGYD